MADYEPISQTEVGERLRIARDAKKITQAEAARLIGAARTTIVAIEQGQRKARLDEIQKLATAYGTSANAILRREAVALDLMPRFRKLAASSDQAVENATELLSHLVKAEGELENVLGVRRHRNYPPERPLLPGNVKDQAEEGAKFLRDWLGLGSSPIPMITSLMEIQLGMRVYLRKLDSHISGLFAFDESMGACVMLNSNHSLERINQSGAHELGHFLAARSKPEALTSAESFASREEQYANFFAREFLTPSRAVRQHFADVTAGQTHLTRRHVILLATIFHVSREAIVRRLEELGLARSGTWEWFAANGGITREHEREVLGDRTDTMPDPKPQMLPTRLTLLVREAAKRDLYSEGQLSSLLNMPRADVRAVLDGVDSEEREADDFVKLPVE